MASKKLDFEKIKTLIVVGSNRKIIDICGQILTSKKLTLLRKNRNKDSSNLEFKEFDYSYLEVINDKVLKNYYKVRFNIGLKEDVNIVKVNISINEVVLPFFLVYKELTKEFLEGVKYNLQQLSLIPKEILEKVLGNDIVIKQSKKLDKFMELNNKGDNKIGAYSYPINKNIVIFSEFREPFIIHEIGHLYDYSFLRGLDRYNFFIRERFYDFYPSLDSYYVNWSLIILKEGLEVIKNFDFISSYTIKDYLISPAEYFADCFMFYYLYPDLLEEFKEIAPLTYDALINILGENRKVYKK